MTVLSVLWFFLIFVLIAGYFVLDGFDLGAGILYPFIAKSEKEQAIVRRSIGPIWDGNEVWLLAAGGALFAAFPAAYATTFSGFYLAIMLVLFGLIVRAVSFEFWMGDKKWRRVWNVCFFVGSLLPALLLGIAAGNIFAGIPMDANGDYTGFPLFGLITPFTLLTGLLGLVMFVAAGASWIALKAPRGTGLWERTARLRVPLQVIAIVLFLALGAFVLFGATPEMDDTLGVLRVVFAVLFFVGIALEICCVRVPQSDLGAFVCQSGAAVSLVGLLACSMFPNLVVAAGGSIGETITLMNAASSELSLTCMTVILCIGLPLVLVYHIIIYRTFRGRVNEAELSY